MKVLADGSLCTIAGFRRVPPLQPKGETEAVERGLDAFTGSCFKFLESRNCMQLESTTYLLGSHPQLWD